jgi:hypothetical protein
MPTINAILIDADARTVEPFVFTCDDVDLLECSGKVTGQNDPGIDEIRGTPLTWFLCEDRPLTKEAPMADFRGYGGFVGKTLMIGYDQEKDVEVDCPFTLETVRAEIEFYNGETFRRY